MESLNSFDAYRETIRTITIAKGAHQFLTCWITHSSRIIFCSPYIVEDKDTVNLYDVRITFEDVVRVTASTIGFKSEQESQEELENALQVTCSKLQTAYISWPY